MYLIIQHTAQLVTLAGPKGPRSGKAMSDLGIIESLWFAIIPKE